MVFGVPDNEMLTIGSDIASTDWDKTQLIFKFLGVKSEVNERFRSFQAWKTKENHPTYKNSS